MENPTFTKFRVISERDTIKLQNQWAHDIKFTQLPKNEVDQCDHQDDSTGEKNFIRVFGAEMAEGIDFSQFHFHFGKMRKVVAGLPELNVITTPLIPQVFQDNLTRCISKIHKNAVIISAFNRENQIFGCSISAFIEEGLLYSIRCTAHKDSLEPKYSVVIQSSPNKKGIKFSEELVFDSILTEEDFANLRADIQKKVVQEFNKSVVWSKRLVYVQRNLSVLDRFMRPNGWQA